MNVEIGTFLSYAVQFISEITSQKNEKEDFKSSVSGYDTASDTTTANSYKEFDNKTQIDLNENKDSFVSKRESYPEENKSASQNSLEPSSPENIDRLDSVDMSKADANWEKSDAQVFLKLLEKDEWKLFNDFRTLRLASGFQGYLFIDKPNSLDIFIEYSANLAASPKKSKDMKCISLDKIPTVDDIDLIRGVVLLFSPLPKLLNLVALRIDFETKNRFYFALETKNTDLSTFNELFKGFGKQVARGIAKMKKTAKPKASKSKDNFVFIKLELDDKIGLQCFNNYYFPYMYALRQDLTASSTETISIQMLKDIFSNYLQLVYSSSDGIERIRNLLKVFRLYTNYFTNNLIVEEFSNLDCFYEKIKQYLEFCFIENIDEHAQKAKSILIITRILNEKLRTYDFIIILFEYIHPTQTDKASTKTPTEHSSAAEQVIHVFGDAYLHVVQVRGIIKSFFKKKESVLSRIRLEFYQMKKQKTEYNLLLYDKSLFSSVTLVLLKENIPIADIICICRVSPAIQYRYLSATYEKNRLSHYNRIPQKSDVTVNTIMVASRQNTEMIDEVNNTISILELDQRDCLDWLVKLENENASYKNMIIQMIHSDRNDGAFKVDLMNLPSEPSTFILVNGRFTNSKFKYLQYYRT